MYTPSDPVIWEIVKRLDDIVPRYYAPGLVEQKPARYSREVREMISATLNEQRKGREL